MTEYDILIKNAKIYEGTSKKPYKGSIGVKGDKVESLGVVTGDAEKTIDAKGLKAVPGFIT
jgi:N-acyl-D-amino-acid deacylase